MFDEEIKNPFKKYSVLEQKQQDRKLAALERQSLSEIWTPIMTITLQTLRLRTCDSNWNLISLIAIKTQQ